jgi:hypothetical protein
LLTSFVASSKNLTQPCSLDVPLYSSTLASDFDEHFLDAAFDSTDYFDPRTPVTAANATLNPDATVQTRQLSFESLDSFNTCIAVDGTDSFDMLNIWQAQMDTIAIDDAMRRCTPGVLDRTSRTPLLCSSDGSYSHTSGPAAFTPKQESPDPSTSVSSLLPSKRPRALTRTRASPTAADNRERIARRAPKTVSHKHVEQKRQCTSSSDEAAYQLRAKQAHSAVERRYRENLNDKIMELHRTLVATEFNSRRSEDENGEPLDSKMEERSKIRKSDVLINAMNYVYRSEIEMRHMSDEIRRLRDTIRE